MKAARLLTSLALLACSSFAQAQVGFEVGGGVPGVGQVGTITVGHMAVWTSTNQIADGGVAQPLNIISTSAAIGGAVLLAGACSTGTATVTGAAIGMGVVVTPNTYPGDGADWRGYVSAANTVTIKVCGIVAITPLSTTYNIRVIQ